MHRRILLTAFWLLTDAALYCAAYVLAYFLRVGWILSSDLPFSVFLSAVLLTIPGWLFVMITMRCFGLTRPQASLKTIAYIAYAGIIGMAGFALVFYFLQQTLFSRSLLLLAGLLSITIIALWHMLFDRIQRRVLRAGTPTYPLLVIGANRIAEHIVRTLQESRSPFTPVAILDGRGSGLKTVAGVPVLGKLDRLEDTLRSHRITHLLQCDLLEQSINLASVCREHHITYLLLPVTLGVVEKDVPAEMLEGTPVISVHPRNQWWEWFFR